MPTGGRPTDRELRGEPSPVADAAGPKTSFERPLNEYVTGEPSDATLDRRNLRLTSTLTPAAVETPLTGFERPGTVTTAPAPAGRVGGATRFALVGALVALLLPLAAW